MKTLLEGRRKCQWLMIFILTGCFVSGCLGSKTPPIRYYVLNPAQYEASLVSKTDGTDLQPRKISLEIVSLRLPQYLEKPQIVTRTSENQLEMAEYHQWGGDLRKNMTRVFARNMSALLSSPNVAVTPFRSSISPDFSLKVDVMQFEADAQGRVRFSAQWMLFSGRDGKSLATRISDIVGPEPQAPADVEQVVTGMGDLLGEFCLVMGREILTHVPGTPTP